MLEKKDGRHEWRFRVPLNIVDMSVDKVRDAQENGTLINLYWGNRESVSKMQAQVEEGPERQPSSLETALGGE